MSGRIGIVAAFPGELKPLVRGWEKRGPVFHGRIGKADAVAVAGGMGSQAAAQACELLLGAGPVDAFVSIGWAGSLSCGLKPPQAVAVKEVIDAADGESFTTANGEGQRLITLDRVADVQEKHRLAQQYQAILVDMEAAAVARIARSKNLAFYCCKGVSDGPNDRLPNFNRFIGTDGEFKTAWFSAYALTHPQYWRPLGTLAQNSRQAAQHLALFVDGFFAASH
jgi:adenosylhomocysteine nucleosidase